MRPFLAAMVFFLTSVTSLVSSQAADVPERAIQYFGIMNELIDQKWVEMPLHSAWPSMVEQETCITLKHSKCWNPTAELKTDVEYGFGLAQLTVTKRFNTFEEVKTMDPGLKTWDWKDRYDPKRQLLAMLVKWKFNYDRTPKTASPIERLKMSTAAYNGGLGGLFNDITLCKGTKGCDPNVWAGNVALTSNKSRKVPKGYGQSPYDINRGYVVNVYDVRRSKYVPYFEGRRMVSGAS